MSADHGPLEGIRILDLSRILAGPTCTQLLGDLGADVIKVERPGAGDDTRKWGPPYVRDADGGDTTESAYYLCANRNKRSVTVNMARPEGRALVERLAAECDVLIENFRTGGQAPGRLGNGHPDIVPYDVFPTADGHIALAVGNDAQFRRLCDFAGAPELADDADYASNDARVRNRDALVPTLRKLTAGHATAHWLAGLEKVNVPCGPVNDLEQVFSDPQMLHRHMLVSLPHALAGGGEVRLIGNPLKLSETPVSYRQGPPILGQHTDEVLGELLGIEGDELNRLHEDAII